MSLSSLDTETALSEPGIAAPRIVCFSVGDAHGCHLLTRGEGLAWFRARLLDPEAHLVGCNIVYDLACAIAAEPDLLEPVFAALDAGRVHDVAIREALLDIAKGALVERGEEGIGIRYGMRLLTQRYLPAEAAKVEADKKDGWRKRYAELDAVPIARWPWAAIVYPLRDAAFPLVIFAAQEGAHANLAEEAHEVRSAFALQLMSVYGIRTSGVRVAAFREQVEAEDRRSTAEFQVSGIIRADGTQDTKRLGEFVTAAYKGSPPKTPTGKVACDRDTLAESGDLTLERYATAGKNDKALTTYLPIVEQGVIVPWNPQFNVLVATTRISSNAQQFPQMGPVRDCIEARWRRLFCSVDYGGLELRTMSQRARWAVGYSLMADALNAGRDCHLIAAASFSGSSEADTIERYAAGDVMIKAFRDLGKIYNFGKGGGMGPAAMVYNARKGQKGETTTGPDGRVYVGARFCLLTKQAKVCGEFKVTATVQGKKRQLCARCVEVARQLDAGWLKAWPEQNDLFKMASRLTKGPDGSSRYVDSSIRGSGVTRGKCGYTQWLNDAFQKLGAKATKRAMWLVSKEMHTRRASPLYGQHLVLNVHDELIAELDEDVAPEAGDRMALIMRETLKRYVPDLAASVEADPALSRTMNKGAKTVRNAAGRLQVWEPKVLRAA